MPHVVNTKELKSIHNNPHGHLIRIVVRVMIVALLALTASVVSICLTVVYNKKKAASATVDNDSKAEGEE